MDIYLSPNKVKIVKPARKETKMTTIGKVKIVEIEDGPFMTDG